MKDLAFQLSQFLSLDCAAFNGLPENKYGDLVANAGVHNGQKFSIQQIEQIRDKMETIETLQGFVDLSGMVTGHNPAILVGTRPKKKGPVRGS